MAGEIKTLKQDDGVQVTAPDTITGEKWVHDDNSWDGEKTSETYTVDGSVDGTGAISDPSKAHWVCYDLDEDIEYGGDISFTETTVTFTFAIPVPIGKNLRFVGTM